jgi:hypothetical protein
VPILLRHLSEETRSIDSGRLPLARMITHPDNPLTARVWVNRVWQWHFGQALVETPSDFGLRSEPPSHPKLLDTLASSLINDGWSTKKLHRLILNSSTWQQASMDRPDALERDPRNRLIGRMNRQRLEFEIMRDAMLQVAGQLNTSSGGPPIRLRPDDPKNRARTLYSYIDREKLEEIYRVFDFPSPDITTAARSQTTVPQQSLFLLNNPFVLHLASALVEYHRLLSAEDPLGQLYAAVYGRPPDGEERTLADQFLKKRPEKKSAWAELAQALLLSNEFQFVD